MKLDLLAIVAHPDDLELSGSGTFIKHAELLNDLVIAQSLYWIYD